MNRNLRAFRAKFEISEATMADLLGIHLRTYRNKEREAMFSQQEMIKILKFVHKVDREFTSDYLFWDL